VLGLHPSSSFRNSSNSSNSSQWCAYLDTLSEELEEDAAPVVYDDFKFVTRAELDAMSLSHLIGTNVRGWICFGAPRIFPRFRSCTETRRELGRTAGALGESSLIFEDCPGSC